MKSYIRATLGTAGSSAGDPCTASVMTQHCHICGSVAPGRHSLHGAALPPETPFPHNGGVTYQQRASACPRCGTTDAVHSIQELAALASSQLGQQPGAQTAGWTAEPQQGPVPGWAAEPQAGPLPGPGSAGGMGGLRSGPLRETGTRYGESPLDALGEDIAGAAIS